MVRSNLWLLSALVIAAVLTPDPARKTKSTDSRKLWQVHNLWTTRAPVTRSEAIVERWMEAARTTRGSRRSWPAEDRAQSATKTVRQYPF